MVSATLKHTGFVMAVVLMAQPSVAKDLSPIYEETFDIAAGGASLTRASRYGAAIANPALLPFSGSFHRWMGSEFSLHINKDSVDYAKNIASGTSESDSDFLDHLFSSPFLAGTQTSLAYLNAHGGIGFFSKFEVDLEAVQYGTTGMPEVKLRGKSYSGVTVSGATAIPFSPVSLGITAKYLMISEPAMNFDLADPEAISQLQNPSALSSLVSPANGYGFDVGALWFKQGKHLDWRLALKVDDIGSTKFSGGDSVDTFKPVASAGIAMTLHTGKDAVHLSVDKRDLQNAYETPPFKAWRAGVKFLARGYIGLAAGYYDGFPSYGVELDLVFLKLGLASYRREYSDVPGLSPRDVYIANFAAGF